MNQSATDTTASNDHVASSTATRESTEIKANRSLIFGILGRLARMVPTIVVVSLLGVLAIWGHKNDWRIPSFASLTGRSTAAIEDWCEEHAVPQAKCVECNPILMPSTPDFGWCSVHGVSNCTWHHPEIAQLRSAADITPNDLEQVMEGLALRERVVNNAACKVYLRRVQFASVDAIHEAGVDVQLVDTQPITESLSVTGEIRYDATRYARLSSRVPGSAWMVRKNVGDPVHAGEVIALIDAMEVGDLKGKLIKAFVAENLAKQNLQRLTDLTAGIVPGKEILEANATLASAEAELLACQQALANLGLVVDVEELRSLDRPTMVEELRFLGFSPTDVQSLQTQTASSNLIPIRCPIDGIVVERHVVVGEVVGTSQPLFEVADPQRMWMFLHVPMEEVELLRLGQEVIFQPQGSSNQVSGHLNWISTAADRRTRMIRVRAELDNSKGRLRDETFGSGQILLRSAEAAMVIPKTAIHWEGCCQIVFVRDKNFFASEDSPKVFHVRNVRTGAEFGDRVEILVGLLPGEVVVTEGSDVLRAQLLKNSLGAGCCVE